jgi:molybdopterin synthase catalytic subunit
MRRESGRLEVVGLVEVFPRRRFAGHARKGIDGLRRFRRGPGRTAPGFSTIALVLAPPTTGDDWIALTDEPLPVDAATSWATTPGSGAVVAFSGVVRDHSDGRDGVTGLTYEAYEDEAVRRLGEVAAETRRRVPATARIALLHRTGDLALSETSVVVVASSPHRAEAFEAARFAIDTLKETVPIWKREHWAEGSDWAECSHTVRPVAAG